MTDAIEPARVESMVVDFLAERFELDRDRLQTGASLRDLGLDSIIMLDVLLDVEDRLGVKLSDLAMPANPTIGDIVALIQRNTAAGK